MADLIKGIDVSSVQSVVSWQAVAQQGIKFSIMKCAEGNKGTDTFYKKNMTGAQEAGLYVASYHFIYPLPPLASQPGRDPVKQAQMHFAVADNNNPVMIDCEWPAPPDFQKWNCTPSQINDWMLQYLQEYERLAGKKPVVYTYPYWASAVKFSQDFAQYQLWIASYVPTPVIPHPWTDWVMWQNTGGGGKLPNGAPVDTDLCRDLSLWGVQTPRMTGTSVPTVNTAPQMPPPPVGTPLNTMLDVQRALNLLGGAGTPLSEDGNNGPKTISAIEAFQASRGLPVDGIPNPATKTVLQGAVASMATPAVASLPVVVATPEPIHPVNPEPNPDAVGPSPARPPHPTLPPNFWNNVMNVVMGFLKNVLHI
jgi:lysozyme